MDKKELIKYALMAVGAFLVWKYIIEPAMNKPGAVTPKIDTKPTGAVGAGTGTGTGTSAGTGTVTNPFKPPPPAIHTDPVVQSANPAHDPKLKYPRGRLLAAANHVSPQTADGWNYYYTQVTGVPQTTDLFTPDNREELISQDEYLSRRTAAGLEADAWPSNWGPDTTSGLAGLVAMIDNVNVHSPWLT
jgi:hypothetical protein